MSTFHLPLKRQPPPPLLRPPRRSARLVLISLALGAVGLAGGLTLGLGLRPRPPVPTASLPAAPGPPPPISAAPSDTAAAGDLAGLRAAREAEEARLASLAAARVAAEAELAGLRRELAAARREPPPQPVAPSPPASVSVPPPVPVAPPPALAAPVLRPPRAEMASAAGQPRIFIHLRAGSPAAAEAAASLAAPLREAGFELGDLRPVPSTPSQRVVRYFHSEDAAAAARLAGRLGRGWAIQDFRSYEPSPAAQTLEIWLPDR